MQCKSGSSHPGAAAIITRSELIVFIVDPDSAVRDSVASLVRVLGGQPYGFDSATACLDAAKRRRPGCLVTEINLPDMDGLQLFEKLGERLPDTPTIFLALKGSITSAVRAMRCGAVDYIEKPFIDRQLAERINELCHIEPF